MSGDKPAPAATWEAYLRRYGREYDPVASAKARAEQAETNARRHAMNAQKGNKRADY